MRNISVLAVGILALIAAVACSLGSPSADPEPDQTSTAATAATQPGAPATPAPLGENVAVLGYGSASTRDELGHLVVDNESAHLALDGDPDSIWNSQQPAPQWFSVVLDDFYLADRIEMVVTQSPAGPTTHEVWLGNGSGTRTLYKRLVNVPTVDGQTLSVGIEPPRSINEVRILTLDSPSWVAWREVRVFGSPSVNPMAAVGAPLVKLNKIATGLEMPVQVTHAGDGGGRLFVVEQRGRIRIIRNSAIVHTPFLDISDRVSCCNQQGLFNVAFPPAYAGRQQFYVSYTNVDGDTIISRYTTTVDPDRADPDSEEIVLAIDQPHEENNGGHLAFGPQDGYLYIGVGDGGGHNNIVNGQDPGTLLGKILRIDVESGVKPYSIPASNPSRATVARNLNLAQIDGYRGEIWALGLRNPSGFAFDKQTGDLYIPDARYAQREEVNYQPAGSAGGENYGWFIMEGARCFEHFFFPCSAEGLTSPVAEYDQSRGCVIVGGAVYRGSKYPDLQGLFIYADLCSGRIWGLKRPGAGAPPGPRSSTQDFQDEWESTLLINTSVALSNIGEDEDGNVYVIRYQDGTISMLTER